MPSSGENLQQPFVYSSAILVQLSSTSDLGPKGRSSATSVSEARSQHENNPYGPATRAALPAITAEQPVSNFSGKHVRQGCPNFFHGGPHA